MAVMLKARVHRTCPYGRKCCDYDNAPAKVLRRRQRAREKQALRQER